MVLAIKTRAEAKADSPVDWPTVLADIRTVKYRSPESFASLDTISRSAVNKMMGEMYIDGKGNSRNYNKKMKNHSRFGEYTFDMTRWELAVSTVKKVSQDRVVWAHATFFPRKHPEMIGQVKELTAPEMCLRCGRTMLVGALVKIERFESGGALALGGGPEKDGICCIPCHQKRTKMLEKARKESERTATRVRK